VPGLINLDFADVRTIMKDAGSALMGIGRASGDNRALDAARQAVASPLLEINIAGAQGILFNITGSSNLTLWEVTEAAEEIRAAADPEANIIFGTSFNDRLGDEVMITVIATGFDGRRISGTSRSAAADRHGSLSNLRSSAAPAAPVPARDFLEELERQRSASESESRAAREEVAVPVRPERAAEPPRRAATYDADDLEIPSFLRKGR